ncbi:hypothetical protein EDD11_008286, partial [Mortierella claussenii]
MTSSGVSTLSPSPSLGNLTSHSAASSNNNYHSSSTNSRIPKLGGLRSASSNS